MRCRTILLLVFALAGADRVAMAMNDSPHYLLPLYYAKVCPVG